MRLFLSVFVLAAVFVLDVAGQNNNEYRTTASISVSGDAELASKARQLLELYLIDAGADPVEKDAHWQIDLIVSRIQTGGQSIALSVIASQLAPLAKTNTSKLNDKSIEQGEWISEYLDNESRRHARYIEMHELVTGDSDELETMISQLIDTFSKDAIEPIRKYHDNSQDH